jgi:cellulose synthase/poly-beta-1,6-N-acetylglucosamine synthase-like glycosyltransferase
MNEPKDPAIAKPSPAETTAPEPPEPPEVTVLITVHDGEETIQSCLRAVMAQNFPMERVELLLVNDRSTDATVERAKALGLPTLRVLSVAGPPERLTARQAALDLGLREARGEIVLMTDADARVPRDWIRELAGHMGFRDGAVAGPVIFGGNHHAIARYQSVEALTTYTLFRTLNRHNLATGLILSNVAVRRSAYLESGGFAADGFSPSEGMALATILRQGGWSLRYLTDPVVQTRDSGTLTRLAGRGRRKCRATVPIVSTFWGILIVTNLALLGWVFLGSTPLYWRLLAVGARYGLGLAAFLTAIGRYQAYPPLQSLLPFELEQTFLGAWVYLSLLFHPKWEWAGIRYDRHGPVKSVDAPAAGGAGAAS